MPPRKKEKSVVRVTSIQKEKVEMDDRVSFEEKIYLRK